MALCALDQSAETAKRKGGCLPDPLEDTDGDNATAGALIPMLMGVAVVSLAFISNYDNWSSSVIYFVSFFIIVIVAIIIISKIIIVNVTIIIMMMMMIFVIFTVIIIIIFALNNSALVTISSNTHHYASWIISTLSS